MSKKKNKTISIIGTAGIPSNYGGFETLADNLVRNLGEIPFIVYCSRKNLGNSSNENRKPEYSNARLVYLPISANGISSIFYDWMSMFHSLIFSDTYLILGVSGCLILPLFKLFTKKKLITNIDGIEYKRDKWNRIARLFLRVSWILAIKHSHEIIADNKAIQNFVEKKYNIKSSLIEYGGDHNYSRKNDNMNYLKKYPFLNDKFALTVCRIEPENNVHMILYAFTVLKSYKIAIIGNWDNSIYSKSLRDKYAKYANIILIEAVYETNELNTIRRNASFYVHGHSMGGTNPSLVEAMFQNLPVIAFDIDYNRETTENKAIYFKTKDDLISIIRDADQIKLNKIAEAMKKIAQRRYKWDIITAKYKEILK